LRNYSEFHDGFFDGLLLEKETAHIFLSTKDKEMFVLEVLDVVALSASDIKAGNIIFEVLTRHGAELTLEDIIAVEGPFPEISQQDFAQKGLAQALKDELILLEINPSYGATCLVLARSVQFRNRQEWIRRHLLKGGE
jgi:hypothetical protein